MKTFLIAQKTGEPIESTYTRCFHMHGRAFVFHGGIYYDWAMGVQGGGSVGCDAELAESEIMERLTQARDDGRWESLWAKFPAINTGKMPKADKVQAKKALDNIDAWTNAIECANYENADPLLLGIGPWAIGLRAEPCIHPEQRFNWDFLRDKCTWVLAEIRADGRFVLKCTTNVPFFRGSIAHGGSGMARYGRDEIIGASYTFERATVCEYPTGDAQAAFIAGFGGYVTKPAEIAACPETAPEALESIPAVQPVQTTPEASNEAQSTTAAGIETIKTEVSPITTTEGATMNEQYSGTERREPVDVLRARALYAATFGASVVITGMWIWAEFQGKPCASVLVALKKNGFRWSPKKMKWYYAGARPSPFSKGGADWSYITEKYGEEEVKAA